MAKRKSINVPRGTLFAAMVTASLVLLLMPQDVTSRFNFLFVKSFGPILQTGKQVRSAIFQGESDKTATVAKADFDSLKARYNNLQADLRKLHKENERLAQLRLAIPAPGTSYMPAEVITSSTKRSHELYINKGRNNKVKVGQYVLAEGTQRIIGTVEKVGATVSLVRLVTDKNYSMMAVIWRDSIEDGISCKLYGDGKEGCKVPLLSINKFDIKVGDSVYAAESKGILNTRRIIGTVTSAKADDRKPLLWDVSITPLLSGEEIDKVAVIVIDTDIEEEGN